ncbi:LppA family lipoprotein [Mycobacterium hubeiense]|uniref:LppA family lipoprotein n=1 Tax=Mycobacterium hubeiense TaxID=1867256 RepID=UPI001E5783F7|nr:LppA family lipoprotein [Mycobacterium sp. QGD 101]
MSESEPQVTGAGDYGYGTPGELGELLSRRDAEQVLADRDRMIAEITAELSRVVPGSAWTPNRDPQSTPCGDFGSTDGKSYTSRHYTSNVPVTAALWQTASQAIIDIAARYGYTHVQSRTENASDDNAKRLTIADDDGGVLTFGSSEAANLYVRTGCYLTAEDKRKARDAAPPS